MKVSSRLCEADDEYHEKVLHCVCQYSHLSSETFICKWPLVSDTPSSPRIITFIIFIHDWIIMSFLLLYVFFEKRTDCLPSFRHHESSSLGKCLWRENNCSYLSSSVKNKKTFPLLLDSSSLSWATLWVQKPRLLERNVCVCVCKDVTHPCARLDSVTQDCCVNSLVNSYTSVCVWSSSCSCYVFSRKSRK